MAAGVAKTLMSEVTCPLCLDVFAEPKRLPCEHVYCKQCLHGLALRSMNGSISCPECRRETEIPKNDVTTLPTAYQVNRLIEMYKVSLISVETEAPMSPQPSTCDLHKSQFLTSFCKSCKRWVCPDCVSVECAIKHHEYGLVDKMVESCQTDMEKNREPILVLHQQVSATLDAMVTTEGEVLSAKEARLQRVESTFDAFSQIIANERRFCKESIEAFFRDQVSLNSVKRRELSKLLAKMELLTKSIDKTSNESRPEFLAAYAEKEETLQLAKMAGSNPQSVPTQIPDMIVELHNPSELESVCKIENLFHYAHIKPQPELVDTLILNKTSHFTLHFGPYQTRTEGVVKIEDITGKVCYNGGSVQSLCTEKTAPDKYSLSFVPIERGAHKLCVKYKDTLICGTPSPIYVTVEPEKLKKLSSTKIKNIVGMKYFERRLYLSERENGIVVFDPLAKSLSGIELKGAGEIAVEKDYFYVTDVTKHRLVKAERDGTIVKSVGDRGNAPGEFKHPKGICLGNNNELYVCDMGNHRIQVFDKDLKFLRVIGEHGSSNGCFIFPGNLNLDEAGSLYVADQDNHRIQVLTTDGRHVCNIGRPGKKAGGELNHPVSVAVHKGMVYVADRITKGISVFKTTGEFVTVFGKGALSHPECIAVDENGYIYVTDDRCKVVSF